MPFVPFRTALSAACANPLDQAENEGQTLVACPERLCYCDPREQRNGWQLFWSVHLSPEVNHKSAETETREGGFAGKRVVAFESRFATEIGKLITNYHGLPILAPAMAEVPLAQNVSAFEFADKLFQGQLPVVLFLTGVGTRALLEVLETRYAREEIVA